MTVISTATIIGQAFKNAGRVTDILGVAVRNGFVDLLYRMKLGRLIPSKRAENPSNKNLSVPERLRRSFEELGPSFIKLGQLLATRSDLLPEAFVDEFSKLQDDVAKIPFAEIKKFVESELKCPLTDVFSSFEEEPMAAASIAQVHGAILKTGERVAVKIQRPGIERVLQNDISILRGLALLLEQYVPESRPFNPKGLVEEFFRTMLEELDFGVESNNMKKIRLNMAVFPKLSVPLVYTKYSTNRVLIMERFDGIRFSDREAILAKGVNPLEIVEAGSDAFFHMVMSDGLFHGDLHPGNLFILPDGNIGMIDFGIVGRLSNRVKDSVIVLFTALIDEDYESLAHEYVNLCASTGNTDIARLQKDLMDAISPYVGMSLGELNAGRILLQSTSIAVRHNLQVPRELMLLFKAMVAIEGMGKKLAPDFDMMSVGTRLAKQVLTTRYSKERLLRDLLVIGRDVQGLAETFPKLLRRFSRKWAQNDFAVDIRNRDVARLSETIREFTFFMVTCVLATLLYSLAITLLVLNRDILVIGFPLWSSLSIATATSVLLRGLFLLRRKRK